MAFGIYLHIPFCRRKCPYCDFNTYAGINDQIPIYLSALHQELEMRLKERSRPTVSSLYFGGGTPSLLQAVQVEALLDRIDGLCSGLGEAEITLEANPGTLDKKDLIALHRVGVNRLSVGCQSFQPELLRGLGRLHSPEDSLRCLSNAAASGFTNLSLDLMYGISGQDLALWKADLAIAAQQPIQHVSLYNLTVEPGTPFDQQQLRGDLPLPEEEVQAQQYEQACIWAEAEGFEAYEISNFARPGHRSLHNQLYWTHSEWLGVGAGAHGFSPGTGEADFGRRWWNLRPPRLYMRSVDAGDLPEEGSEVLSPQQALDEALLLGLRTSEGWDLTADELRLDRPILSLLSPTIADLEQRGVVSWNGSRLKVSQVHRITTDSIIQQFAAILDSPPKSATVSSGTDATSPKAGTRVDPAP